jgi:hypothetical protein
VSGTKLGLLIAQSFLADELPDYPAVFFMEKAILKRR